MTRKSRREIERTIEALAETSDRADSVEVDVVDVGTEPRDTDAETVVVADFTEGCS